LSTIPAQKKQEENRKLRLFFSCYPPVSVLFSGIDSADTVSAYAKRTPRAGAPPPLR